VLFARTGCNLVLTARRADKLAEVKAKCEEALGGKGKVLVIEADMTKREDLNGILGKLEGLKVDM
jgi:3-hydroxy acid dehydrogenase/malonic semialdehyde reductase